MPRHKSTKPYATGRTPRRGGIFLNTTGNQTLGIGVCGRCNFKFPLDALKPDPNTPGLLVCLADRDDFDPYRMPARQADKITLPFVRPDVPLTAGPNQPADWEVTPDPVEPFPRDT